MLIDFTFSSSSIFFRHQQVRIDVMCKVLHKTKRWGRVGEGQPSFFFIRLSVLVYPNRSPWWALIWSARWQKLSPFSTKKKKKKKIRRFCLFISKTQSIFDRAVLYESSFENVFKSKYKKNLGRERREVNRGNGCNCVCRCRRDWVTTKLGGGPHYMYKSVLYNIRRGIRNGK